MTTPSPLHTLFIRPRVSLFGLLILCVAYPFTTTFYAFALLMVTLIGIDYTLWYRASRRLDARVAALLANSSDTEDDPHTPSQS